MKKILKEILLTAVGTVLSGFAIGSFLLPNKLSSGGFAGIATIFYYFLNWNVGITVFLLNIPLFIFATFKIGRRFLLKTIIGTILLSLFIDSFENVPLVTNDRLLASIYGGVLVGIGMGFIFKANSSTGGSDLIVNLAKAYKVKMSTGRLLSIIDMFVVILNVVFFREVEIGLYSLIVIFLDGTMIDIIFEGVNFSKLVYIVSDKSEEILKVIRDDLQYGATEIYGKGSFLNEEKIIIMTAINRREIPILREMVNDIDAHAFFIVTNAREVYGLGFKSLD